MNGEILNIKEDGLGVILAEDGNRYFFTNSFFCIGFLILLIFNIMKIFAYLKIEK